MAKQKQAEFTRWMGPILDALRKLGGSGTPQEVSDAIADELKLPDAKREELIPSGMPRFHNQVCWARQYLVWEGYKDILKARSEASGSLAQRLQINILMMMTRERYS